MDYAPSPPEVIAAEGALTATLVVLVAAAVVLAAHCVYRALRDRSPIALLALAGGVVALPIEPFWDVNVLFTFATNSDPIAFTAFGREIPLYLAFIYPAFIGWGSFLGYRMIRRRASAPELLRLPLAFFVADAVIEIAGIRLNLWAYYGDQPLAIADWPILFGALNGTITLLGGALLVALEPRLTGWRKPLLALAVPTAYIGIYAIAGWPTWFVLNADVPEAVGQLAGVASVGICALAAWLVADAAASRNPRT